MKKLLIILLFLIVVPAFAQTEKKSIYSGGMLILQPGYTIAKIQHKDINNHYCPIKIQNEQIIIITN